MIQHSVSDIDAPELKCVNSDATLDKALERMLETGQPQLGVMRDDSLAGIISHRDITRMLQLSDQINQNGSILDKSVIMAVNRSFTRVSSDDDLFTLFDKLADAPYVLIDDGSDPKVLRDVRLHQFLKDEIKEFLLIEEIERTIRDIIRQTVDEDLNTELTETFESLDIRTPSRLVECSFRHYSIFISDNWDLFEDRFDNNRDFVRELIDRVGDIRNQMFHFRDLDDSNPMDTEFVDFAREHLNYIHSEMR